MPLSPVNQAGDLPPGVHRATLEEVVARFGGPSIQRAAVTARLQQVYRLACSTGRLRSFPVFGSYVTAKAHPHDVDVVLIMDDAFR